MMQRGFTLVELLVVLAILAALTLVAVSSVDVYQDQARYEATQRTLQNVEDAVLGPANQRDADGSPLITGFVADMGRLPDACDVGGGELYPRELWEPIDRNGSALPNYAIITDATDPEIHFGYGWRGPYLRLGVGQTRLLDGWGNRFDLLSDAPDGGGNRAAAGVGSAVRIIRSLGGNGTADVVAPAADAPAYDRDLYVNFVTQAFASYPAAAAQDRISATVVVRVIDADSNPVDTVDVKFYGPEFSSSGYVTVLTHAKDASNNPIPGTFVLNGVLAKIGPKVIRAYSTSDSKKSPVRRVVLTAGANNLPDLVLK